MKCGVCFKEITTEVVGVLPNGTYHCGCKIPDIPTPSYRPTFKQPGDFETGIASSGEKRLFKTGAQRDSVNGKPRMELLPDDLLMRVASWYTLGAEKYGDNNWRLGQPQADCLGSAKRHLTKYEKGDRDEDHLSAIIFNILSVMNVDEYFPDDEYLVFKSYRSQIKK